MRDIVTKQYYTFVTDDEPNICSITNYIFDNCKTISLGNHVFNNEEK